MAISNIFKEASGVLGVVVFSHRLPTRQAYDCPRHLHWQLVIYSLAVMALPGPKKISSTSSNISSKLCEFFEWDFEFIFFSSSGNIRNSPSIWKWSHCLGIFVYTSLGFLLYFTSINEKITQIPCYWINWPTSWCEKSLFKSFIVFLNYWIVKMLQICNNN